jgi:putative selenium metabolism hydrolase
MSRHHEIAQSYRDDVTGFLRDIVAIPSPSGGEGDVAKRIVEEMERLGYDEAGTDGMGSVIGRIGNGARKIVLDAHIDTVGVGDPASWAYDPYEGKVENDIVFGRGTSDNKGAVAAQVYSGKVMKDLGIADTDATVYVVGTVMEEDCDGLALGYALTESLEGVSAVILGEATGGLVYRGHRGRMEIKVTTKGVSAHASAPERGDNAITAMAPLVAEIDELNERLAVDEFLGKGTVAVTKIECETPSLNAIPDSCTIYLDRRLTVGEDRDSAIDEVMSLASAQGVGVEILGYQEPAYTGLVVPTEKYFPTWVLPEDHPVVVAGVLAGEKAFGAAPATGRWVFSTNGISSMGRLGIPTIGYGPSEERWAHSVLDQCPIEDLVNSMAYYAALPEAFAQAGIQVSA